MSNVFIIHGTEGYPEENWFPWLKEELEEHGCSVYVPQFPSPPIVAANVADWFEVWKANESEIAEESILIGHSLGGVFTLRILEQLQHPIRAACFIGTPIGMQPIANFDRDNAFSGFAFDWPLIRSKASHFAVYQSDNDPYVGLENGKELAQKLGCALTFIPNAGHFNSAAGYTTFSELRDFVLPLL